MSIGNFLTALVAGAGAAGTEWGQQDLLKRENARRQEAADRERERIGMERQRLIMEEEERREARRREFEYQGLREREAARKDFEDWLKAQENAGIAWADPRGSYMKFVAPQNLSLVQSQMRALGNTMPGLGLTPIGNEAIAKAELERRELINNIISGMPSAAERAYKASAPQAIGTTGAFAVPRFNSASMVAANIRAAGDAEEDIRKVATKVTSEARANILGAYKVSSEAELYKFAKTEAEKNAIRAQYIAKLNAEEKRLARLYGIPWPVGSATSPSPVQRPRQMPGPTPGVGGPAPKFDPSLIDAGRNRIRNQSQ